MLTRIKFFIFKCLKFRNVCKVKKISREGIKACGFILQKSNCTCTICKEHVYSLCLSKEKFRSFSGEIFYSINAVAATCIRCRWVMEGEVIDCDDKAHTLSLENFLMDIGLPPEIAVKFNPQYSLRNKYPYRSMPVLPRVTYYEDYMEAS